TMVATYGSASSFLGGPGAAYSIGLGWVLLSMTQVATGYFVLLILGKKFAIVTRRFKAITLIDFLKERYKSHTVVILSAFSIIIFLFSAMAAQWVGGAYLIQLLTGLYFISVLFFFNFYVFIFYVFVFFSVYSFINKYICIIMLSVFSIIIFLFSAIASQLVVLVYLIQLLTGLSYTSALFIFTLTVIIYVVIGGFRAVALTDTLQGIVMFFGTLILLIAVI